MKEQTPCIYCGSIPLCPYCSGTGIDDGQPCYDCEKDWECGCKCTCMDGSGEPCEVCD